MDQAGTVTRQQVEFAIDRDPSKLLAEFLASNTGALLYKEESKLWCAGPAYIEDLYRQEIAKPGTQ